MSAPDRVWVTNENPNGPREAYIALGSWPGERTEYIRADLVPQWMQIDENTPKDVVLLLGWYGYGDKWDTTTDYWHNSRGGWQHGSATHYQIITPPPAT